MTTTARLRLAPSLLLCAALCAAASPVRAQEQRPADDAGIEARVAEVYGATRWPKASAPRAGVDLAALRADGWRRLSLDVDPASGSARLGFARGDGEQPSAVLEVRLHASPAAARRALLAGLGAVQTRLRPEEGLGDVAFGGRSATGALGLVLGARGNVSYRARALDRADVAPLAVALDGALRAAPALEPGVPLPAPRLLSLTAVPADEGPVALHLDQDPSAPQAAFLEFRCSPGASVVRTRDGLELYASGPGPVTIEVLACSKSLATTRATFEVVVPQ